MGKRVREKVIYARVNDAEEATIAQYVLDADTTTSDLIRDAIKEYMARHPVKQAGVEAPTTIKQPGEV